MQAKPELPRFVDPPLPRRPATRAELLDLRRQRAIGENALWLGSMRTIMPPGHRLGAPGRRVDAPPRLTHLDAHLHRGGTAREKWWGRKPLFA